MMKKRDLKRENRKLWLDVETLGAQLAAEQLNVEAAEALVNIAEKVVPEAAKKEMAELRRQVSDAREAATALHRALYPQTWHKGFGGEINKVPATPYPYTINIKNDAVNAAPQNLSPNARETAKAMGDWSGLK